MKMYSPPLDNKSNFIDEFQQELTVYEHQGKRTPSKMSQSKAEHLQVIVRVRPPLPRELKNGKFNPISISLYDYVDEELDQEDNLYSIQHFQFDHIYSAEATQKEVYEHTVRNTVSSMTSGYNATIIAYGQTGTGKTYTMEGFGIDDDFSKRGIIQRSIEQIFEVKDLQESKNQNNVYQITASYLQIYQECLSDLLEPETQGLQIRQTRKKGVFVEGISEWEVSSKEEILQLIQKGSYQRVQASTKLNDMSSRSHAIFIINLIKIVCDDKQEVKQIQYGKLNLVDLAGSERLGVTGATGQRLEECKKINQSLSCLGNVICALTDPQQRKHIPYRNSKLTRLLEDSLGGNCRTIFMAMISPAFISYGETLSTLKFARRAKKIKQTAKVNQVLDTKSLLKKYEKQIKFLKCELKKKEQQIQKVQPRKNNSQFHKYLSKKETPFQMQNKRNIERQQQQQSKMESQEIQRLQNKYETNKILMHKYKDLLLKQRDIMIALSQRLQERDDKITQQNEDLNEMEQQSQELYDQLQESEGQNQQLEQFCKQKGIEISHDNPFFKRRRQPLQKNKENSPEKFTQTDKQVNKENLNQLGNLGNQFKQLQQKYKYSQSIIEDYYLNIQQQQEELKQQEELNYRTKQYYSNWKGQMQGNLQLGFPLFFIDKMSTIVQILTGKGDVQKLYTVAKDIVELKKLIGQQLPEELQ